MARPDGPPFADRVAQAGLTPQQRETGRATLLLAELVDELCGLIRTQNDKLDEQNGRLDEQNALLDDIRNGRRGDRTPSGPTEGKGGGGDVQLREPAIPPPDPDDTAEPGHGRAVANPATAQPSARRPTAKTTAGKTATKATKATAAPRRGTKKET